jgi:hypothetical protein
MQAAGSSEILISVYQSMKVIQKVSSDGLLKKKTRIASKPFIFPFDVHTIHYFSA